MKKSSTSSSKKQKKNRSVLKRKDEGGSTDVVATVHSLGMTKSSVGLPNVYMEQFSRLVESLRLRIIDERCRLSELDNFTLCAQDQYQKIRRTRIGMSNYRLLVMLDEKNMVAVMHLFESQHNKDNTNYDKLLHAVSNESYVIVQV